MGQTNKSNSGLRPRDRKLAATKPGSKKITGNQWQNTPQQHTFMEAWLSPTSSTFGNAFQSAIVAGYGEKYANQIASPSVNNKWIQEYTNRLILSEDHIIAALSDIATGKNIDSRSKTDTQVKALEILGDIKGMTGNKGGNTTNVIVQPILNGQSVNRKKVEVIDQELIPED